MNPDLIIALLLGLVALALIIGGPILVWRRAARLNAAQEAEARAFEQEILIASRQGPAGEARPASGSTVPPRTTVGQALPAYGEPTAPAEPASAPSPEAPPPAASPSAEPPAAAGPSPGGLSPFARTVIDKLEVAGTFQAVEGPLRCANPDLKGTLISLKGGRRLGIIDAGFEREDATLQALLRHMDGLVVEGGEGEALVFKRFQDFLSEVIAF